jgi:diacylglycerol kinase
MNDCLKKRLKAFGFAYSGIRQFVSDGVHPRFHLLSATAALVLGFWLQLSSIEWVGLVLVISGVLVAEMFNSALETLADTITLERHPGIKKAKDISAGAVLVAALAAVTFAGIIFAPKILHKISLLWTQTV